MQQGNNEEFKQMKAEIDYSNFEMDPNLEVRNFDHEGMPISYSQKTNKYIAMKGNKTFLNLSRYIKLKYIYPIINLQINIIKS